MMAITFALIRGVISPMRTAPTASRLSGSKAFVQPMMIETGSHHAELPVRVEEVVNWASC